MKATIILSVLLFVGMSQSSAQVTDTLVDVNGHKLHGTNHDIWQDNPNLIITIIAKSYAETQKDQLKIAIYEKAMKFAIDAINFKKKTENE